MPSSKTTDVTAPDPGSTKGPKPGERGHGLQNGERLEPWDSGFTNPYGVPYQHQEPAVGGASLGAVVSELFASFAGDFEEPEDSQNREAKPRKPQFTEDQLYLTERVNAAASRKLTFGTLHKLNRLYGVAEVTEAMRDCCIGAPSNPTGYVTRICRERA